MSGGVRESYDAVAELYARLYRTAPRNVLDDALVDAFRALAGGGPVADVGCGPGHLTAHLRDAGVPAAGFDLSAAMLRIARAAYPGVPFAEGSATALPLADASVAGVLAWYSLIHLPPAQVPLALAEIARVLVPGGHLLVGFLASDDGVPVQDYDHRAHPAYRWSVDRLGALAGEAGLAEVARARRVPDAGERHRHGRLVLSKV